MIKLVVALLMITIICSACSSQYSDKDQDTSKVTSFASDQLGEYSSVVSLPENDYEDAPSSSSAQEETNPDSDNSSIIYYEGLTQEQWQRLQDQKELYGDLSYDEIEKARYLGADIDCPNFKHLEVEHSIALEFIDYVSEDEFETWINFIEKVRDTGQCITIYSFVEYFSIELDEFLAVIEKNNLINIYDIDTVKRRYEYFVVQDLKD